MAFFTSLRRSHALKCVLQRQFYAYKFQPCHIQPLFQLEYQIGYYKRLKSTSTKQTQSTSILLDNEFTIKLLAKKMKQKPASVLKLVQEIGEDVPDGLNTVLDLDVTEFILLENGFKPIYPDFKLDAKKESKSRLSPSVGEPRPPVITIMGHVDHGKTTLLDTLRKTAVASGEAGGITQHIGAFSVGVGTDKTITFIDTPGHAAFNTMRYRGAQVTDQVILVVAADDGVQEQTVECISHAKAANVPILIAINKIDRPNSNVDRVKNQLLVHGLQTEEQGGDIPVVEISALKNQNIDKLLDTILVHAELCDLRADPSCPVEAVVLESNNDKRAGLTATVLVQQGTLRKGSYLVAGSVFAKVRQLFNDQGRPVNEAFPSHPVQILGWRNLPEPGDQITQHQNESEAKAAIHISKVALRLQEKAKQEEVNDAFPGVEEERALNRKGRKIPFRIMHRRKMASNENKNDSNSKPKLNLIIKADVSGSLEALIGSLSAFKSEFVDLDVISASVGSVTTSDIQLAEAIEGIVYGFNVNTNREIETMARNHNVILRHHNVIYRLLADCKEELANKLPIVTEESLIGEAAVLKVFTLTGQRKATVAGCRVKTGSLSTGADIVWRVVRDDETVHQGQLQSLKRGSDDVNEAKKEMECGIAFKGFSQFEEGDRIRCVRLTKKTQEFDWKAW